MNVLPGQKLPEGWRWVRLGDVCEIAGQPLHPQDYPDEFFSYYSVPAYDAGRTPIREPGSSILSGKVLFSPGTVLFCKLNPRINRVWLVADQRPYRPICSTEFAPLLPRLGELEAHYLAWLLQSPMLGRALRGHARAATKSRERLKPEDLLRAPIPLPPLFEQRQIASILDEQVAAVGQARAVAEAQLEAARALPVAYLRKVFESEEAIGWPRRRLGEVLSLRTEIVHPRDNPRGPAAFVGLEHIESDTGVRTGMLPVEMSELTGRKPRFHKGDLVYGSLRPYLNKVWVAEFDGLCSVDQFVYQADATQADIAFIAWFMRSPLYLRRAPITTTPGQLPRIRTEEVASVAVGLPPLPEQRQQVARLEAALVQAERLLSAAEEQMANIRLLPSAFLRRAFRGEL